MLPNFILQNKIRDQV